MLSPPVDLRDAVRHPSSGTQARCSSKRPVGCFGRSPHFGKTHASLRRPDYKVIVFSREVNLRLGEGIRMTTIDYFRASRSSLFRPCGAKTLTASTGGTASFARVGKKRTPVNPQLDSVPKLPVPQLGPAWFCDSTLHSFDF
jgi:hypothetical protein